MPCSLYYTKTNSNGFDVIRNNFVMFVGQTYFVHTIYVISALHKYLS